MVAPRGCGGSMQRSRIPLWNALKAASPGSALPESDSVSTKCTNVSWSSRSERSRTPLCYAASNSSKTSAISSAFRSSISGLVLYLIKVRVIMLSLLGITRRIDRLSTPLDVRRLQKDSAAKKYLSTISPATGITRAALAMAILSGAFAKEERAWALGIFSGITGCAIIIGPAVAHIEAKQLDPNFFLGMRLFPDMYPYALQCQQASP